MRAAPRFWFSSALSWQAVLLLPFAGLYGLISWLRMRFMRGTRVGVPVICVGNFTVGGTGKTPTVIALVQFFKKLGKNPYVLSRGYGGTRDHAHLVDLTQDTAAHIGDEAVLIAPHAPVVIGADRVKSAQRAIGLGADMLIMDDGMQNPGLHKTLTLALLDCQSGIGNGLVFPAGPLRGFISAQLAHTQLVLLMGAGAHGEAMGAAAHAHHLFKSCGIKTAHARLEPAPQAHYLKGQRVLAFCGIGQPEKFRATLIQIGAQIEAFYSFPDHHPFTPQEALNLVQHASTQGLTLVTTAKDHARLLSAPHTRAQLAGLANVVPIDLVPEDPQLFAWIAEHAGVV